MSIINMPYKSQKQRRFFHTQTAKDKGISEKTVNEFDKASKGMNLPEKTPRFSKLKEKLKR